MSTDETARERGAPAGLKQEDDGDNPSARAAQSKRARLARIAALVGAITSRDEDRHEVKGRWEEARELQRAATHDFGAVRGWHLSRAPFGPQTLSACRRVVYVSDFRSREREFPRRFADHPYHFRDANQRAVAVAAHLYDFDPIATRDWAAERGLRVTVFGRAASWWNPGRTTLILFEAAEIGGPTGLAP